MSISYIVHRISFFHRYKINEILKMLSIIMTRSDEAIDAVMLLQMHQMLQVLLQMLLMLLQMLQMLQMLLQMLQMQVLMLQMLQMLLQMLQMLQMLLQMLQMLQMLVLLHQKVSMGGSLVVRMLLTMLHHGSVMQVRFTRRGTHSALFRSFQLWRTCTGPDA